MYYDKNGRLIKINDILFFEEIGFFRLVMRGQLLLEKCDDSDYPHLVFDKIIFDSNVRSAYIVD